MFERMNNASNMYNNGRRRRRRKKNICTSARPVICLLHFSSRQCWPERRKTVDCLTCWAVFFFLLFFSYSFNRQTSTKWIFVVLSVVETL